MIGSGKPERRFILHFIILFGHLQKDREEITDSKCLEVKGTTKNCGLRVVSSLKPNPHYE